MNNVKGILNFYSTTKGIHYNFSNASEGRHELHSLDGDSVFVDESFAAQHQCTVDEAESILRQQLDEAIAATATAFRRLAAFKAIQEGKAHSNSEKSEKQFLDAMNDVFGKKVSLDELVQSRLQKISKLKDENLPQSFAGLFSVSEQNELVGNMMSKLHAIASELDDSVSQQEDNPAFWVEVIHRELFADEIAEKRQKNQKQIRKNVNRSIADGLRKRGIKPSADFDPDNKN